MTTAELVNLIVRKFGGNRVEFILVSLFSQVAFKLGGNTYRATADMDGYADIRVVKYPSDESIQSVEDNYSRWVEGVLNGMVRNEEGELVKQ